MDRPAHAHVPHIVQAYRVAITYIAQPQHPAAKDQLVDHLKSAGLTQYAILIDREYVCIAHLPGIPAGVQ